MQIRQAEASDYEQLMQLYNLFVGEDRYSRYDNDSFQKVLESENNYIFVAEEEGKLIGFATCSMRHIVRYPYPVAQLDELFVLAEYRRHGLGKQLVEKVEQTVKENGCLLMYIESGSERKEAHIFYEKIGYTNNGYYFKKNL